MTKKFLAPQKKGSKGNRYKQCKTTDGYYQSLLTMFGPKYDKSVADNFHGPKKLDTKS